MLIKKIMLHNIRSYVDAEIEFNEGKTLIAGDIGSGKSTVLVAIEFALFGLLRGEISGGVLLRHGSSEGFVELCFEVNNRIVVVHRSLKRTAKSIDQDVGFIVINGKKTDMTATELKANILEILGYPAELVAKSKSLLFRYTIYTPQEDMKQILLGDRDERLNIIRRVFGIDKYKRIKDNVEIYGVYLREQLRELYGRTLDLDEKKNRRNILESELLCARGELEKSVPLLAAARSVVEIARSKVLAFEDAKKRRDDLLRSLEVCKTALKHFVDEKSRIVVESQQLSDKISLLRAELNSVTVENSDVLQREIFKKNGELSLLEKERLSFVSKIAGVQALQRVSAEIIQKIQRIDNCPLCLQKVDVSHKDAIVKCENEKMDSAKQESERILTLVKDFDEKIKERKTEIDFLKVKERSIELIKFKQQDLCERSKNLELITKRLVFIEQEFVQLTDKKVIIEQELGGCSFVDEEYVAARHELDLALSQEKTVEISYNLLREKVVNIEKTKLVLDVEICEKERLIGQANLMKRLNEWIHELFCPLVDSIEKHVLGRVYTEFNDLFKKWFGVLVDDEFFSARLNDCFAPVLEQNGFDTLLENLSGGEKTACALAYRLALNKAINEIMTLVETKDLLILDEPTDGFSDAQLDKVGEVFDYLGLKQIIIVSHERKVESFVDHILHVNKTGHISCVESPIT